MALNLRHIEAFKALMETGTVSQAADVLFISQPAASKLIAAFEREIPFPAFIRERGRLVPTAEARLLYDEIDRVFSGLNDIRRFADDVADHRVGRLNIGVLPALSAGYMQVLIAEFMDGRPNLRVSMETRTSLKIIDSLAMRKIDIGITNNPPDYAGVVSRPLYRSSGVCALPIGHPLAVKQRITAEDLHGEAFISLTALDGSRQRIDSSFNHTNVRPDIRIETPLSSSACGFVAENIGVAIVDPFTPLAFRDRVTVRPYEPKVYFDFHISLPAEETAQSMIARQFEQFVIDKFARLEMEQSDS